jgi:ATP-dependent Lhr-like helicase
MASAHDGALEPFAPFVSDWFIRRFGEPTAAQQRAWPLIARGEHVLVTAPTGSGKTLAAFLWPLNQLLTGAWEGGSLRVLYVSPLKALNSDIERNLVAPLGELQDQIERTGSLACRVRVRTRSGDTPQRERREMLRQPPEILITTPESLNLLLTSPRGRQLFTGLAMVILDEIHAVAGGKRGTHLMTAVERLVPLAGEFQRLSLSATVRPIERIARFVGGFELIRKGEEAVYRKRRVEIVRGEGEKRYEIAVHRPREVAEAVTAGDDPDGAPSNLWELLASEFRDRVRANRSTLIFANDRRTTERLTRLMNDGERSGFVYSHHGSLSREIRSLVEQRLKDGELRGLVATNSLELGIDIGALDEVLLVKTPPSVASAVQRLGRAGHRVGEVSRGRFYPLFGRDLVSAAVVAFAVEDHDIEEISPIEGALDVLAQVILSMTANETWRVDELLALIRATYPYRNLSRRQFDLVLDMLTGRYGDSRIRELSARLSWDRIDGTVRGRPGTARLVYTAGGTIPDRGYFHLRVHDSMAKLGELDEEFVWERSVGDTFTLGAQAWRIRGITHNDVLVSPALRSAAMAPFWRAEEQDRSFHLSARMGEFLEEADTFFAARDGRRRLQQVLERRNLMTPEASQALVDLLVRQRDATGGALPHRHHLLIERATRGRAEDGRRQLTIHTGWGGRVNRPFAIALAAAWESRHEMPLEIDHDNDCILIGVAGNLEADEIFELVRPDNLERLLRSGLSKTGFFGARFRENAGCALLLPRSNVGRRVPLWLQRERGKKLLLAVSRYEDFPIIVETWRACLQDAFEIEKLKELLGEVETGAIRVSEATTEVASPFAANLRWKQTNRLMYEDDTPESGTRGGLSTSLLREVVFSSALRPRLPADLVAEFEAKVQRRFPGYAPGTAGELLELVKERVILTAEEWDDLTAAIERDLEPRGEEAERVITTARAKLAAVHTGVKAIVALETVPRLARALGRSVEELLLPDSGSSESTARLLADRISAEDDGEEALERQIAEWSRSYGPLDPGRIESVFGIDRVRAQEVIESLADSEQIVVDRFRDESDAVEVCDAENLERLLRLVRARSRPRIEPRPVAELPAFLATWQGLSRRFDGGEGLKKVLEQLLLWPAPARVWETEIFPARLEPYFPEWIDSLMQESDLMWLGLAKERLCFLFPADLELVGGAADGARARAASGTGLDEVFPGVGARYGFSELLRAGLGSAELTDCLWAWAWEGKVSNTTFMAVRKGVESKFRAPRERTRDSGRRRSGRYDRWQTSRPFSGDWYRVPAACESEDLLEREDLNRERARILLDRYGVVFRELLSREMPALRWGSVFRSLRLMELSGEVVSGYFFTDVPGPQFAARSALRLLVEDLPEDRIYWLNATDPASPSGLGLAPFKGLFPARKPSNHIVFHGSRPVLVSRRSGASLTIEVAADHPDLPHYLEFLKVRLSRRCEPARAVDVETINGVPAARSPFAEALASIFSVTRENTALRLRRRY